MPASSRYDACSMVSTPAAIAMRMDSAPCACAATFLPTACAMSTTAGISSCVISGAPGTPPNASTAPEAMTLSRSEPLSTRNFGALAKLIGPARDTGVKTLIVRRFLEVRDVQVAAAVRNGEIRAARLHARPRGLAAVDRVAQRSVGAERIGADVARAGEAG